MCPINSVRNWASLMCMLQPQPVVALERCATMNQGEIPTTSWDSITIDPGSYVEIPDDSTERLLETNEMAEVQVEATTPCGMTSEGNQLHVIKQPCSIVNGCDREDQRTDLDDEKQRDPEPGHK